MVQLITHKYISKSQHVYSLLTFTPTIEKHVTSNFKLLLTMIDVSTTYLWAYWIPWMIIEYYICLISTKKQFTMACSTLSLEVKMEFVLTFSGIKVMLYYHGWWSPINRVPIVNTWFWRLSTISSFQGRKMLSKMHLGILRKLLENC
jgi:hypothetical protein